jgi:hypothetical protein
MRYRLSRRTWSVGATLVVFGCASAGGPAPGESGSTAREHVALEQLGETRWRATYHLDEPARVLHFQRPATFYRERVWDVMTPGYEFAREGDLQVLQLIEGATPRDEIVVEFDQFTGQLTAEYELFVEFSDGGRAIYTGHLYVRPDARDMVRTVSLAPSAGENAVIRGGVYSGPTVWTDDYADGTYVFFGSNTPLTTDEVIVVFDDGLPAWLRAEFDAWLPRLFALYRDRMGAALPWKPLVLYGHQDSDQEGYSYGGGTLTGLIQLTVSGSAWTESSTAGRQLALGFLAHEIAHLWNGQLTTNNGTDPWVHEGSADEMSDRLLFEFGVLEGWAVHERREEALNGCFMRLQRTSIKEATDSQVTYECGQVMALWTEAAIRAAGSDTDLFGFWRALVEKSLRPDSTYEIGVYDAERYLDVVGSFGVSEEMRSRMRRALEGAGDPVPIIVSGLHAAGLELEAGGRPSSNSRGQLARSALSHVMGGACNGRYSFSGVRALQTYPIEDCAPFAEALLIDRIDGFEVAVEGEMIYDAIVDTCAAGGSVRFEDSGSGETREVRCEQPLAPRPSWYSFVGFPNP